MKIDWFSDAYIGPIGNANAQQCMNWWRIVDPTGSKGVLRLIGTPGLSQYLDYDNIAPVRGLHVMGSNLYAVVGNTFYKYDGTTNTSYETLDSSEGFVYMENNGTQIMAVDGTTGYIWDGSTLTKISDLDFPGASSLAYLAGYFIVTKPDSGEFYISTVYDGTGWAALDYATAEGDPDNAKRVFEKNGELWIFGAKTIEIDYHSGSAFPFDRISGAVLNIGLDAAASVAKSDKALYWLADDLTIQKAMGYQPTKISTEAMDSFISRYSQTNDAIGFCMTVEGYTYYNLIFPKQRVTWQYCEKTGLWNTWSSWPNYDRHRCNCYAFYNGNHLIGDWNNGIVYKVDPSVYSDDGEEIKAVRTTQSIHADRLWQFFSQLEIEFEAGTGLVSGQGEDPQAMLDWSNDLGRTWSNEHWRSIGKIGEYRNRAIWRRLGRSRDRIWRLTVSDQIKKSLISSKLDGEMGIN